MDEQKEIQTEEPGITATDEPEIKPEPEAKPEPEKEIKDVPFSALHEERTRRQELQFKIREKDRQIKDLEDKINAGGEYTDDDSGTNSAPQTSSIITDKLLNLTVSDIVEKHKDAHEMLDEFDKAVDADPGLYDQMLKAPNPGKFAYNEGKRRVFDRKYGTSNDEKIHNIKKEVEKEVTEKVTRDFMKKYNIKEQQPKTLNKGRAAGGDTIPSDKVPTVKDIWG